MKRIKPRTATTTTTTTTRELAPKELTTVIGGALNAYFEAVTGEKQGK